ncbi:MAG: hypothetical protein ABI977_24390 [Acidobacteriota bacterium]
MATDVRLDDVDGTYVVLDARVVKALGADFMLDSAGRRKSSKPFRRALVHDQNDGLTVNFNGDYVGGVTLIGVTEIVPQRPPGTLPRFVPNLVVRGGISYEVQGIDINGKPLMATVVLNDELNKLQSQIDELSKLQSQISELQARVADLEDRA